MTLEQCSGHHISDELARFVQEDFTDQQARDLLVSLTARAMTGRLQHSSREGVPSWHSKETSNATLLAEFERLTSLPITEHSITDLICTLAAMRARIMVYGDEA